MVRKVTKNMNRIIFTSIFLVLELFVSVDAGGICSETVEPLNYPCQEHKVTTKDGYILSLQNIRHKTGGEQPPVLLQHGLFVDATTWLLSPPDQSLPLVLADQGFDVWLVSTRGTVYSRGHTSLSPNDAIYWDWTWDELAAYDLPASLKYVHGRTRQKIHYVGHSQGTLIALAAMSKGMVVNMLRSAGLLCPIAYISHLRSPLVRDVGEFLLSHTSHWLQIPEFNPMGADAVELLLEICKQRGPQECIKLLNSLKGQNCCINSSITTVPQSTSTKNVIHLSQMMRDGTIKKYDYGDEKANRKHYGSSQPPSYDMRKIADDIPLFLAHGGADVLSVNKDVKLLLDSLSLSLHESDKLIVEYREEYGHSDFVMGLNAREVVYDCLIAFFRLQ